MVYCPRLTLHSTKPAQHLADEKIPDNLDGPSRSAWIQRQRLRVDTCKWAASKLRPRVYGDRLDVRISATGQISITAALAEAQRRVIEHQFIDAESARVEGD